MPANHRRHRKSLPATLETLPPRTLLTAAPADLHVNPGPFAAGQPIYIWGSVANATNLPANTPFSISLSPDNTPGNADDIPLGSATANPSPNNADLLSLRLDTNLPSTLPAGSYHLVLTSPNTDPLLSGSLALITPSPTAELSFAPTYPMVGIGGTIIGGNEYTQSDATAHSAIVSHIGDNYDLSFNVANAGLQSANPKFAVYLSRDSILGNADDILVPATIPYPTGFKALAPALSTSDVTLRLNLPANLPAGSYHPIVLLDPDHLLPESDTSDNTTVGPAFTVGDPTTDLSLTSVTSTALTGTVGTPITVSASLAIAGSPIDRPDVFFFIQSLDNPDTYYFLGNYTFDQTLAAGSHDTPDLTFNLPINLPAGNYVVHATAGTAYRVAETDLTNNETSAASLVTILNPDGSTPPAPLMMQTLDAPTTPSSNTRNLTRGSSSTTSLTLTNPTNKRAATKTTLHYYLSADNKLSKNDRLFSTQSIAPTLRPGQSSYSAHYTLPTNTRLGTQYLIVTADTPAAPHSKSNHKSLTQSTHTQSVTRINVTNHTTTLPTTSTNDKTKPLTKSTLKNRITTLP